MNEWSTREYLDRLRAMRKPVKSETRPEIVKKKAIKQGFQRKVKAA